MTISLCMPPACIVLYAAFNGVINPWWYDKQRKFCLPPCSLPGRIRAGPYRRRRRHSPAVDWTAGRRCSCRRRCAARRVSGRVRPSCRRSTRRTAAPRSPGVASSPPPEPSRPSRAARGVVLLPPSARSTCALGKGKGAHTWYSASS